MCQESGYKVESLTRVRIMNIELGGLKIGEYRIIEGKIAIEAIKVIEEYGEISMGELIEVLTERMKPTGHDMEIISNRNDTYFSQKVRNLRSHKNKIFFSNIFYDESIDKYVSLEFKNKKPNLDENCYKNELKKKKNKAIAFYAKKLDFERINKEKKLIGNAGEVLVYEDQLDKVSKYSTELVKSVRFVSKIDGDGAGYDILSFNEEKKIVYIEVKATTGKKSMPFYMSSSEYTFFELHKENYIIARVYEFDIDKGIGKIEYISGINFNSIFDKEISAYRIYYKK